MIFCHAIFTVVSLQKKVFARSNIGFIAVNKQYFDVPSDTSMYNRVVGVDYNLASANNFWSGKFFYHRSFQPGNPDKQYSQGSFGYLQNKASGAWPVRDFDRRELPGRDRIC